LLAGTSLTVEDTWDTTGADRGHYRAVGFLRYGAGATDPVTADLRTRRYLYLPLVLRTAP
jgi:hypothetical protein